MKLFLSYKAFFSYPLIELWIVANAVKRKKMEWGGGLIAKYGCVSSFTQQRKIFLIGQSYVELDSVKKSL